MSLVKRIPLHGSTKSEQYEQFGCGDRLKLQTEGLLADEYKNDQLKKKCFVVRCFTNLFLTFILL